ncbi:MAG: PAS domain-containing protein [Pseudomonadota bacterium]
MPAPADSSHRAPAAPWRGLLELVRERRASLPADQVQELAVDTLGVIAVVAAGAVVLTILLMPAASSASLTVSVGLAVVAVTLRYWARRRYSPAVPWVALGLALVGSLAWIVVLGTVQAVQSLVLLLPIVFSTFLFGARAGLGVAAMASAAMFLLAYLQSHGAALGPRAISPWNQAWVFTEFAVMLCLVLLVLRRHMARWQHAEQEQRLIREREAELREVHQRLATAVQAGQFGSWDYDVQQRRFSYDAQEARIYGLAGQAGERPVDDWYRVLHPDDRKRHEAAFWHAVQGTDRQEQVVRVLRPDGAVRWVHTCFYVERDETGQARRLVGLDRDVTQEMQSRQRQEAALQRRNLAVRAVRGSLWEYDGTTGFVVRDKDLPSLLGWPDDRLVHRFEDVLPLVEPAQQEEYRRFVERIVHGDEDSLEAVFSLRLPGGQSRHLRTLVQVERDAQGRARRAVGMDVDVTGDVRARHALQETNERLTVALSAVQASVWELDAATGRLQWDERGAELYGLDLNADPSAWERLIVPADRETTLERWHACLRDPRCSTYALEYTIERPDGVRRHIRCTGRNERDEQGRLLRSVGLDLDVTEQRETARRMEELAARLTLALSVSGMGVWMVDLRDGRREWNDELYRIYGLAPRPEGLSDAQWEAMIHLDDRERVMRDTARTRRGELQGVGEFRIVRPDGEVRHLRSAARQVRDEIGRIERIVGVTFDVTDQHRATEAIERARLAAVEASRLKSEFLANVSHEIRTPMNGIIGMTELALQGRLEAREQAYVAKAHQALRQLLGVLNDLLDFSKIEAGKLQIEHTEFALEDLLERSLDLVAPQAAAKGLELVVDVPASLPAHHVGDPTRLGQVLSNLLSNAVKFTEQGSIVLRVREADRPQSTGTRLRFEVCDTGIGLDADQQSRLFEPFTQADASTTRRFGGTGLGLVISRRLVEFMGGAMGLHSQPGHGSTFWFELALGVPTHAPVSWVHAACGCAVPHTVVVFDASGTRRAAVEQWLQAWGHRVVAPAEPQPAALGLAAADDLPGEAASAPVVVLLDAALFQASRSSWLGWWSAHASRPGPRPRVHLVCGLLEQDELRPDIERLGWQGCLLKPVLPGRLCAALHGQAPQPLAPAVARDSAPLAGVRVLLAEDNPLNQELACEILERAGVEVTTVGTGAQAVREVQRQHFDLVLMDVQMPEMDGLEATEAIRALGGRFAELPIVAMTAHAMAGDRELSLRAGMNEHLTKPIDSGLLVRTLARWTKPGAGPNGLRGSTHDLPASRPEAGSEGRAASVLDPAQGLRVCGGMPSLYRRALERFAEMYREPAVSGREPAAEQRRQVHSLKGVAASLGLRALEAVSRRIEPRFVGGGRLSADDVDALERALAQARRAVADYLASDSTDG